MIKDIHFKKDLNLVLTTKPFQYAQIRNERLYCYRYKDSGFKELIVYKMIWQ